MTSTCFFFFFFNDTATTEIYTLSLHDALPICLLRQIDVRRARQAHRLCESRLEAGFLDQAADRSEEHTSELQSQSNLVCRLLLEKKKKNNRLTNMHTPHHTCSLQHDYSSRDSS